jgi:hypothetical protein
MDAWLNERDWRLILDRIEAGNCTPFLGAGACHGVLPLGREVAKEWAKEYGYPLEDAGDLVRVSQFLAVNHDDAMFPKELLLKKWRNSGLPNFANPDEPHRVLASLPLPVYMTTNYDNYMVRALRSCGKNPIREICRWNRFVRNHPSVFDRESQFEASEANPVVFHLHGHDEIPESLVLTEDDYLDFLVNVAKDDGLLPPRIQRALTGSSILFVGYAISDWDFRVLFRSLVSYLERTLIRAHVAVQIAPGGDGISQEQKERTQEYLTSYYEQLRIRLYWGTAWQFALELRQRWEAHLHGR